MLPPPRRDPANLEAFRVAKQTLLLVDADPKSARVLEVSLRKAGYSVTHVTTGPDGLEAIDMAQPDLVLSDTRLAAPSGGAPTMDGYQFCRRLKDDPVWCHVPFIFLTSSSSIEDKIRGLELGVEDYLTKPIYIKEILTRIQLVLAKKQRDSMEARSSRASFSGLLSEMGLVDLMSTIDLGRKSGLLEIHGPSGKGAVQFRDGRVVEARCGRYVGAAAVYRMLVWNDGRFEIRFGPCAVDDSVDMSTQGLLMEGMRRLDEWQRLQEQLPPLDQVYEVNARELSARLGEIPDEVNQLLRLLDGHRTLMEVVDDSGFDDLSALATLSKLYFEGLIVQREIAPTGSTPDAVDEPPVVLPGGGTPHDGMNRPIVADAGAVDLVADASILSRMVIPASEGASLPPPAVTELPSQTPAATEQTSAAGDEEDETTDESAASSDADGTQEPSVAKHRGKRGKNKHEPSKGGGQPSTASPAPTGTPATSGDSRNAAGLIAASAPSASQASADSSARHETHDTKPDARVETPAGEPPAGETPNNVIQFPTPSVGPDRGAGGDLKRTLILGSGVVSAVREEAAKSPDTAVDAAPAGVAATPPATERAASAPVEVPVARDSKPSDTRSGEIPSKETPKEPPQETAKETPKPEARDVKSVPETKGAKQDVPAREQRDPKTTLPGTGEALARDRKTSQSGEARDRKTSQSGEARDRKTSSGGERDRKISFSGELNDEAKSFFTDSSPNVAYKRSHDDFQDLKPSDDAVRTQKQNRQGLVLTIALIAGVFAIVVGFAVKRRYFDPPEATLPPASRGGPPPTAPESGGGPLAGGATADSGSSVASATTDTGASAAVVEDSGATTAALVNDSGSGVAIELPGADAGGATTMTAEYDAGGATTMAAARDAGSAGTTVAASGADASTGVAPPSGPDALLTAATRARSRGAAAAVIAYQAYLDGGGTNAQEIANFSYWLANRQDLGRAGEWAQRATGMDDRSQLAWYVLGVARRYGPTPDRASARTAFQHCIALPGRYAAECRGAQ